MRATRSLLLVAVFLSAAALADERVRILSPSSLKDQFPPNGELTVRPAMFGIPSYAQTLTGTLVYVSDGIDPCQPINKTAVNWPVKGSVITLVDRNVECTFVQKVRNTEQAGGIAAIVVDNVEEDTLPYMADDGTGRSIGIPSVIIFKKDGDKIKAALRSGETVQISMAWSLPAPDNRVEVEFWTSSGEFESLELKRSFGAVARALGNQSLFEFHYMIYDGYARGCTKETLPCGSQCINHGLYCAEDPDGDIDSGISGADVVMENLRQICLIQALTEMGRLDLWWDYTTRFADECSADKSTWTEECSYRIMRELGVNTKRIDTCYYIESGGVHPNMTFNKFLQKEIDRTYELGVFYIPTVYVNMVPYRGALTCRNPSDISRCGVFQMICQGYQPGTEPAACFSDPQCPLGQRVDKCGVCGGDGSVDSCGRCLSAKDPSRVDDGGWDACGKCLSFSDPNFNKTCLGCDGVPNSGKTIDRCGQCKALDDPTRDQGCEDRKIAGVSTGVFVGVIITGAVVIGACVWCYMKRREARLRDDIDALLRQYLPLDANGALGSDTSHLVTVVPSDKARSVDE